MIEQSAPYRNARTVATADAGYHSDANLKQPQQDNIPAPIADNTCIFAAGQTLSSFGSIYIKATGQRWLKGEWQAYHKLAHAAWQAILDKR